MVTGSGFTRGDVDFGASGLQEAEMVNLGIIRKRQEKRSYPDAA